MNENIFKYKDVKVKDLKKDYEKEFTPSQEYLDSMPDLQNSEFKGIPIDFVGIQGFHLPLKVRQKDGGIQEVMAEITGTVSLDAASRGINMSRILRSAYKSKDDIFDINKLEDVLRNYQKDLKTFDAHILMNFQYHIQLCSYIPESYRHSSSEQVCNILLFLSILL